MSLHSIDLHRPVMCSMEIEGVLFPIDLPPKLAISHNMVGIQGNTQQQGRCDVIVQVMTSFPVKIIEKPCALLSQHTSAPNVRETTVKAIFA